MAKAPRPGLCKTRLVPPLSPAQAAGLSTAFLRDITENLRDAARTMPIAPYVAYAPAGTGVLFNGILAAGTDLVLADGSAATPPEVQGFGRCLLHAVQNLFARGHTAVCVLNSDSPTLPTSYLRQAALWLAEPDNRVVMGPADDGGYYLLGHEADTRRICSPAFPGARPAWPRKLAAERWRLASSCLSYRNGMTSMMRRRCSSYKTS